MLLVVISRSPTTRTHLIVLGLPGTSRSEGSSNTDPGNPTALAWLIPGHHQHPPQRNHGQQAGTEAVAALNQLSSGERLSWRRGTETCWRSGHHPGLADSHEQETTAWGVVVSRQKTTTKSKTIMLCGGGQDWSADGTTWCLAPCICDILSLPPASPHHSDDGNASGSLHRELAPAYSRNSRA
jgi:hypothetical protein